MGYDALGGIRSSADNDDDERLHGHEAGLVGGWVGLICGYAKERAGRNGWKKKDVGELDRDGDKGKGKY